MLRLVIFPVFGNIHIYSKQVGMWEKRQGLIPTPCGGAPP